MTMNIHSAIHDQLVASKVFGNYINHPDARYPGGVYLENLTDLEPGWTDQSVKEIQNVGAFGYVESKYNPFCRHQVYGLREVYTKEAGFVLQALSPDASGDLVWINISQQTMLINLYGEND